MTYSESQSQQEVNDILSSIRQMISEEEAEGTKVSSAAEAVDKEQNEVLDLTRLVQADGSIIELPAKTETPPLNSENQKVNLDQEIPPSTSTDFKSKESFSSSKQEENTMNHNEEFDVNTFDHQAYKSDPDMLTSQANSMSSKNFSTMVDDKAQPSSIDHDFLSAHTVQESAAAFAALSRATENRHSQENTAPPTVNTVADYTVDDLMRELLRPLLKDWLDAHLPSLVKSLVLEQIEKVLQQPKTDKAA